jgi:DnaD/phage-associated family protein
VAEPEGATVGRGGFPEGARATPVPNLFFSDVLPEIEDEAELLVTLYAFYLLGRKRPASRFFVESELRAEAPLLRALDRLARIEGTAVEALQRGLATAVRRGTLLRAVSQRDGQRLDLYTTHTHAGLALLRGVAGLQAIQPIEIPIEPSVGPLPNIFALYEANIGVISPLLAEQLREAEAEYPWPWIEAAFREAVALNRRNWRYIERILQRWRSEGPDLEAIRRAAEGEGRSLAGRYWRHVQR